MRDWPDTDQLQFDQLWREQAPRVLGALVRAGHDFADAEDAVQLALMAAAEQWPVEGVPASPGGWLLRVASRRLIDQVRSEAARRRREEAVALEPEAAAAPEQDDTLSLLVLCAHPALTAPSQVALMLRAVGGLTTAEIAACFFVPEATMAQRISRAKATLRRAQVRFEEPEPDEMPSRLQAARHAIALLYSQAHAVQEREGLADSLLALTSVRLARELWRTDSDPESGGLLALLLLTHARAAARIVDGELVELADQDRSRWNVALIAEGVALVEQVLPTGPVGTFQLQAAIAAVHAETAGSGRTGGVQTDGAQTDGDWAQTDWAQIKELYRLLVAVDPSPASQLGWAIAVAEVDGPEAGLALLAELPDGFHRRHAVAGHLWLRLGRPDLARQEWLRASELSRSRLEQRLLNRLIAQADKPSAR